MESNPGGVWVVDRGAGEKFSGLGVDLARLVKLLSEPFNDCMDGSDVGNGICVGVFREKEVFNAIQSSRSE